MQINLETASENDLDPLLQLQRKAFHGQALIYNDFTLPPLMQTINDLTEEFKRKTFYKAVLDGKIIASVRCFIKDHTLYIEKLIVDPDMQSNGIGTCIMLELESRYSGSVDRYQLSTGHKSARNLHLYTKLGYKEIRQERLNDTCNLIVMEKKT